MARRWNQIFSGGVVWDDREPLPHEFQREGGHSIAAHLPEISVRPLPTFAAVTTSQRALPTFTVQQHGRNVLPPLSVTVDASIVGDTARVAVTQQFWNDSIAPIKQAAFTFPLPAGCTVTDFSCRIGTNKIIKGTVKPKEDAREDFQQHIRHHDTAAAILEQDTPEIFTTALGNIPERTTIKVNLTYITLLKYHLADRKGVTTLTIPTHIASRYGNAPDEYNDAASSSIPQGLTLEVEIVDSRGISSIVSPSHNIVVERRQGARNADSFADLAGSGTCSNLEAAFVKLESGAMFLDKDFVLDIVTMPDDGTEEPQAWLEEHPTLHHNALMLTLPAGFMTKNDTSMHKTEILFLADLSGSMYDKRASLHSAMHFFLKGIPEGRRFNIWCFGSGYMSWQVRSVDYDEATLNSALSWMSTNISLDMGGTELLPAVKAIVAARDKALMTDVIVLTDGEVWRLDETLDYIRQVRARTEGRVRFFSLGIGKAVSHALVNGIAEAGGGYAEVVQDASKGGWEDRVVSMAKAALMSDHFGPLHIEFSIRGKDGVETNSALLDAQRSPADISALNPFNRNRLYFLFEPADPSDKYENVVIHGAADQEVKSFVIPITVLEKREATLHKLAAKSMLDDLESGRSQIHLGPSRPYPGSWEETNTVRKEAEKIASNWSLVSKWTSFFLTEEPYVPTRDDGFVEGVVQVKESPGDDLLQPHDGSRPGTSAEAPLALIGRLQSLSSGTPNPPIRRKSFSTLSHLQSVSFHAAGNVAPGRKRGKAPAKAAAGIITASPMGVMETERTWVPRGLFDAAVTPQMGVLGHMFGSTNSERVQQTMGSRGESGPPIYTAYGASEPDVAANRWEQPRGVSSVINHPGAKMGMVDEMDPGEPGRAGKRRRRSRDLTADALSRSAIDGYELAASFSPHVHTRQPPLPLATTEAETQKHKETCERSFIHSLLWFQTFEGCINFGDENAAKTWLGEGVTRALGEIQLRNPSWRTEALWTAAVYVLLGRDFESCESLWALMAFKAHTYLRNYVLEVDEMLLEVKEALEGLEVPMGDALLGFHFGSWEETSQENGKENPEEKKKCEEVAVEEDHSSKPSTDDEQDTES